MMGRGRDVHEGDPVDGRGKTCLAGYSGEEIRRGRVKQKTAVRGWGGNVFQRQLG